MQYENATKRDDLARYKPSFLAVSVPFPCNQTRYSLYIVVLYKLNGRPLNLT